MNDLEEYFENKKGIGVLSTASGEGKVNAAVYARPHFMEDGTVAVIMRDRLSHANLQSNPYAAYLFIEEKPGYKGKRLYLQKLHEEESSELIAELQRRKYKSDALPGESRFLVYFKIEKVLPLVGAVI